MRRRSTVGYAFPGGLLGLFAFGVLFPAILTSGLLFGGAVALLLAGGLATIAVSTRTMLRR